MAGGLADITLLQGETWFVKAAFVAGCTFAGAFLLGPFMKKIFNSPEMHIWHHAYENMVSTLASRWPSGIICLEQLQFRMMAKKSDWAFREMKRFPMILRVRQFSVYPPVKNKISNVSIILQTDLPAALFLPF
jgi:hypothetical protein